MARRLCLGAGLILAALAVLWLVGGCAAGNERYLERPAGFWAGLWHGVILIVTFIISLFSDSVTVYEAHNSGGWYNFGFVLGVLIMAGNGGRACCRKPRRRRELRREDWDEIGRKIEEKVRRGIRNWAAEREDDGAEWEEIGRKVEEKIKRELRDWADR
jgi:hypothetical protein